jgi:hypothetical protein
MCLPSPQCLCRKRMLVQPIVRRSPLGAKPVTLQRAIKGGGRLGTGRRPRRRPRPDASAYAAGVSRGHRSESRQECATVRRSAVRALPALQKQTPRRPVGLHDTCSAPTLVEVDCSLSVAPRSAQCCQFTGYTPWPGTSSYGRCLSRRSDDLPLEVSNVDASTCHGNRPRCRNCGSE